jgi:hypothetical protein
MNIHIFYKKIYQHKFHWISVTNSEPSNAYSTKSGSNYPDQQHVPHVDFLSENNHIQYWYSPNLTTALRLQHETTLVHVPEVVSNIQSLVYTKLVSFALQCETWHATWFLTWFLTWTLTWTVTSFQGIFLWHERFMNGSEQFTMLKKTSLHAWFVLIYCADILWYKNIKKLVARSCGRAAASQCRCNVCRVRFSAHIHQVKSSACSVWISCVTSSLLLSFLVVCSCLWCFIL